MEKKSAFKETALIGEMLSLWDFVVLVLKVFDWFRGNGAQNNILVRNGFVYKGSAAVGLLTIILTAIRSNGRTSCSDAYPGSQCSYDKNPTYMENWINAGIETDTWDCVMIGIELMWMAFKTHKLAPVEFGYICVDQETGEPIACPTKETGKSKGDTSDISGSKDNANDVCVDQVTGEPVDCADLDELVM
jgi:hypothetical protein